MNIRIDTYSSGGPTAFYPTTKFFAIVSDADKRWAGATGYCKTREAAQRAGERLVAKLEAGL
jgi:hypothetical protein